MAQLRQRQTDFEVLETQVLMISFESADLARAWRDETGSPFTLLLDREREVYRAYGLEHSLARSWGPKTIWSYIRLMLAGRRWRGVQGDSGQLGGDFVIDPRGIIRLAYRSRDPTDRPSVQTLLTILRRI